MSLCSRARHFQHLPCSGITGVVQLEGGPLFFNLSFTVALKQRLYEWLWYLQCCWGHRRTQGEATMP